MADKITIDSKNSFIQSTARSVADPSAMIRANEGLADTVGSNLMDLVADVTKAEATAASKSSSNAIALARYKLDKDKFAADQTGKYETALEETKLNKMISKYVNIKQKLLGTKMSMEEEAILDAKLSSGLIEEMGTTQWRQLKGEDFKRASERFKAQMGELSGWDKGTESKDGTFIIYRNRFTKEEKEVFNSSFAIKEAEKIDKNHPYLSGKIRDAMRIGDKDTVTRLTNQLRLLAEEDAKKELADKDAETSLLIKQAQATLESTQQGTKFAASEEAFKVEKRPLDIEKEKLEIERLKREGAKETAKKQALIKLNGAYSLIKSLKPNDPDNLEKIRTEQSRIVDEYFSACIEAKVAPEKEIVDMVEKSFVPIIALHDGSMEKAKAEKEIQNNAYYQAIYESKLPQGQKEILYKSKALAALAPEIYRLSLLVQLEGEKGKSKKILDSILKAVGNYDEVVPEKAADVKLDKMKAKLFAKDDAGAANEAAYTIRDLSRDAFDPDKLTDDKKIMPVTLQRAELLIQDETFREIIGRTPALKTAFEKYLNDIETQKQNWLVTDEMERILANTRSYLGKVKTPTDTKAKVK